MAKKAVNLVRSVHARRENRIAGAEEKASKNEAESDRLYQLSQKMADAIPMGQPILIDHHSEKSDRRGRHVGTL
jgi:hypothetical protein